ncbi:MAG: hypothetical protein D6743_15095 [Calditrichaeota bacterium]|nr:MAG: hypothetical protein D6743_15095 [Calditrichota bacterium]
MQKVCLCRRNILGCKQFEVEAKKLRTLCRNLGTLFGVLYRHVHRNDRKSARQLTKRLTIDQQMVNFCNVNSQIGCLRSIPAGSFVFQEESCFLFKYWKDFSRNRQL